jgi:hypothetical protein
VYYSYHNFNNVKERNSFLVDAINVESEGSDAVGTTAMKVSSSNRGGSDSSSINGSSSPQVMRVGDADEDEEPDEEPVEEEEEEEALGDNLSAPVATSTIPSTATTTTTTIAAIMKGDPASSSAASTTTSADIKPHRLSSYIEHMHSAWWYVYNPIYWRAQRFRGLRNTYMSCIYQMSSTGLIQHRADRGVNINVSRDAGDKIDSSLLRVRIRGQAFYLK